MPTPALVMTPTLFRASLPGVNALSPLALTEQYLAIDSSWPKIERLYAKGKILGSSIPGGANTISMGFSALSSPPIAWVVPLDVGTTQHRDELTLNYQNSLWDVGGTIFVMYTFISFFRIRVGTSYVAIDRLHTGMQLASFDWLCFVFRP